MAKYCVQCRYPLDHLRRDLCPECGRPFDPRDADSFASTLHRVWKIHVPTSVVWCSTFLTSAFYFFTIQYAFISWWQNTSSWWWFLDNVRGGSIWVIEGPGLWMVPIQYGVGIAWSAVFAMIVARRGRQMELIVVLCLMLLAVYALAMTGTRLGMLGAFVFGLFTFFAFFIGPLVSSEKRAT